MGHSGYFIIFQLHSREPISTYFLTDTLSKALQLVPLKDNPFADNIAISKTKIPRNMETYSLNAFSWLSLTYKVCLALFTTDFKRTHFYLKLCNAMKLYMNEGLKKVLPSDGICITQLQLNLNFGW